MADLAPTGVELQANSIGKVVVAAGAVAISDVLYLDSNNRYAVARAGDTQALAEAAAIAVTAASALGDKLSIITSGDLKIVGAALTPGVMYALSTNLGKIAPIVDLVTDDWTTLIGTPKTTEIMAVSFAPLRFQQP